jgi:hypothetical protein
MVFEDMGGKGKDEAVGFSLAVGFSPRRIGEPWTEAHGDKGDRID